MAITRIGLNQSINLASNVTGTLATGNGGTGATSFAPGKVLQVAYGTTGTAVSVSSNTYTDAGFTTSITPTATDNHIYLNWFMPDNRKETNNTNMNMRIYRQVNGGGYSSLVQVTGAFLYSADSATVSAGSTGVYKDTTYNSTAQVDYKIYFNSGQNNAKVSSNKDSASESGIFAMEVQS